MLHIARFPLLVLALSYLVMWVSARIGASFRKLEEDLREDFTPGAVACAGSRRALARSDSKAVARRQP
jgi:hypothetical protein